MSNGTAGANADPLRVLVSDDHPFFREGLRSLLTSSPGTKLVGESSTGEEAVSLAGRSPTGRGTEGHTDAGDERHRGDSPDRAGQPARPRLGRHDVRGRRHGLRAMRAGARGYLLKGANYAEMLGAIRAVGDGKAIFSPGIAVVLANFFAEIRPASSLQVFPELSDREREVFDLIAHGHKNPEIAKRLYLSPKTVHNHVSNILSKLQVTDGTQAIIRARKAGLG